MKLFLGEVRVVLLLCLAFVTCVFITLLTVLYHFCVACLAFEKANQVLSGSDEEVLQQLSTFGLTRDGMPSELTGHVVLDHDSWLEERMASDM